MSTYLLLRDHIQSGPYSLEELKGTGIYATDLLWINGISTAWRYPNKIEELRAFVHPLSSLKMDKAVVSDTTLQIQKKENSYDKTRENGNDYSQQGGLQNINFQPEITKTESEQYEVENPAIGIKSAPNRNIDQGIRKYNVTREETSDFRRIKDPGNENHEYEADSSLQFKVISVIIADDHTLFRQGVKSALSLKKDVKIVGEAENGMQLLHMLKHTQPDVILLDIQMPIMDGISALTSIRKNNSDIKVITGFGFILLPLVKDYPFSGP